MTIISNQNRVYSGRHWKGGEFFAFTGEPNDDWSEEKLKPAEKIFTIEIGPAAPKGTIITCATPIPNNGRPRGYPSIRHGNYENGLPPVAAPARRISDMKCLEYDYALDYHALVGGDANILFDSFLLRDPNDSKSKAFELGVMPLPASGTERHAQTSGADLGRFYNRFGRAWDMRLMVAKNYLMAFPLDGPALSATIDQLEIYRWAIGRNIITGELYYPGMALGLEPIGGTTQLVVDAWAVTLD